MIQQALTLPPPPPASKACALPYGTVLRAGLGESVVLADMDFETYSEAGFVWNETAQNWAAEKGAAKKGLPAIGLQRYAEHPSTEVLSLAYDLKDGAGRRLWLPGMEPPYDLFNHIVSGKLIEAFNVGFEERVWNCVCTRRYNWPPLPVAQLRCAMAKARAHCLPGSLAKAGEAAGVKEAKNPAGSALLNRYSIPRKPTKNDPRRRLHPMTEARGVDLYRYNEQDIVAEAELSALVPDLSDFELRYWQMDQQCNREGVRLDMASIDAAIALLDSRYEGARGEMQALTMGAVQKPTEVQRITAWLAGRGVATGSLDEEHVTALLGRDDLPAEARRVLEIRQEFGSAAVKKLYTMRLHASEAGRAHNMFEYHGARTGRDAGRGIQPQNMPNSGPATQRCECGVFYSKDLPACPCGADAWIADDYEWDEQAMECALARVRDGTILRYYPKLPEVLSGCLRGLFISDPGHDFIGSDYSAIEAVVAACLAGCQWRVDTFWRKEDIYLASISAITGTPLSEYKAYAEREGKHHPDRKLGKVAELASGYGGWTGAWVQFGADSFFDTEQDIINAIKAWRNASPEIVEAWGGQIRWRGGEPVPELYGLEGAFLQSIQRRGVEVATSIEGVSYYNRGGTVYCKLPSGRYITYHNASAMADPQRPGKMALWFWGYNSNPKMGQIGWAPLNTYGGRLFENVVQAVARDIMAFAAVNLNDAGYIVKLRVHDELVVQVPEGAGSVEQMEAIANTLPGWAARWPITVSGGWRGKRFRK